MLDEVGHEMKKRVRVIMRSRGEIISPLFKGDEKENPEDQKERISKERKLSLVELIPLFRMRLAERFKREDPEDQETSMKDQEKAFVN